MTFIIKNHVEILHNKSRIVINYRRLNDNTLDDTYNILDRDYLLSNIQDARYFSKFHYKSDFH